MKELLVLVGVLALLLVPQFGLPSLCFWLDERVGTDNWRTRTACALLVVFGLCIVVVSAVPFIATLHAASPVYDEKIYCEFAWWDFYTCGWPW